MRQRQNVLRLERVHSTEGQPAVVQLAVCRRMREVTAHVVRESRVELVTGTRAFANQDDVRVMVFKFACQLADEVSPENVRHGKAVEVIFPNPSERRGGVGRLPIHQYANFMLMEIIDEMLQVLPWA